MRREINDILVWLTVLSLIISVLFINVKSFIWFNLFTNILIIYGLLVIILFILWKTWIFKDKMNI